MARFVVVLILGALALPGLALADADPASDTLYTGRVFLPLSVQVSQKPALQLAADAYLAEKAGKPIRVALIAKPADLGGVPGLFGKPTEYARFLAGELQFVYPGPVLIVMPQGAALAENAKLVAEKAVIDAKVQPGADGLARTAIELVEKLAGVEAPEGFTVPTTTMQGPSAPVPQPAKKKGGGFPGWASAAIGLGAVCLLLAPAAFLLRRRSR